jgi:predicted DNA-binding transcriptional regulator AlpA
VGFTQRVTRPDEYERYRDLVRPTVSAEPTEYRPLERRRMSSISGPTRTLETRPEQGRRRDDFEAGHPRHVPETWPTLLSRDQLCAYIGVSVDTITRICPVRPLDLGANLVRYSRRQIDDWVATLPPRLMVAQQVSGDGAEAALAQDEVAESRTEAALDRVRARADGVKWRKIA